MGKQYNNQTSQGGFNTLKEERLLGGTKEQAHQDYVKHKDVYIERASLWSKKFKEENPEEWAERRREYDREQKKRDRADPIKHEKIKKSCRDSYWKDPQKTER